jgi:hypothetical protein
MRILFVATACFLAAGTFATQTARADETSDLRAEMEALKRRVEAQDRKMRELEGTKLTQDEVSQAVSRYLEGSGGAFLVGGADEAKGSAGFPMGKKPFIKEGPNEIRFIFRNQVRYEAFLYSDDAVGTLATPAGTISDAAPRDRSGFEIERLYFGVEGSVFCPDITYHLTLNFDSDTIGNVEKEFMWLDWKYSGEHHIRAGVDKVPFTYEEQNSTASLAFADRSLVAKAFALGSDTGVTLWGWLGDCECPKHFMYKVQASTGEGAVEQSGSVFNTDAFDTYSDQLLFSATFEWNVTCKDWAFDEVDHRACDDRCRLDLSIGASGYYENDDDTLQRAPGALALRSTGTVDRWGASAWVRARWQGLTAILEGAMRNVDYTADGSTAEEQQDMGAELTVHYRFSESNWGIGAKAGIIWLDDDYDTITVGTNPPVAIEDTITEVGFVVNYFFWDHSNKVTWDITWVQDNSGVNSSAPGYMWGPTRGVIIEDGILMRLQWQINL